MVPSRTVEKQVEVVANILNNLVKTKKPIVLVTTKNDDANETYVREVEKLVARKEYKGAIPIVETSAHENINVDQAFIALAQLANDRNKGRLKIVSYNEAARGRRELLELSTDAFQSLIRSQVSNLLYIAIYLLLFLQESRNHLIGLVLIEKGFYLEVKLL